MNDKITAAHLSAFGHLVDAMRTQYPDEDAETHATRVRTHLIAFGASVSFTTRVAREWLEMYERFGGQGR